MFAYEEHENSDCSLPTRKDVHILGLEGGWIVTIAGSDETFFDSLEEAEEHGRAVAQREQTKLFVHSEHGQVIKKECFEADPRDCADDEVAQSAVVA